MINKEVAKVRMKKYREGVRADVISNYGGKCVCCGEKESVFLTIDHKNGGGSKARKKISSNKNIKHFLKNNNYPKDFQLLCFNCNWASRNGRTCPHQIW